MRRLLAGLLLVGACSSAPGRGPASASGAAGSSGLKPNATVVSVTDGDTITVRIGNTKEKVRLLGIDTPETKKPNTPVQCFGPEATEYTTSLLPVGTALHLERDLEARDKYGRLLAYVYRSTDGMFVNLQIIRHGYARLLTFQPNVAHADDFTSAAAAARHDHIGLWATCSG